MSMRYLARREPANDFSEIHKLVTSLEEKLGAAAQNLRKQVPVTVSPAQTMIYQFEAAKKGDVWVWLCPCVEFIADNEATLRDLLDKNNIKGEKLVHLAN